MAPVRIDRSNRPFTEEEKIWIILKYGKLRNELQVCRAFRLQFIVQTDKMKDTGLLLIQILRCFLSKGLSIQKAILVPTGWNNCPLNHPDPGHGLHWMKERFDKQVISRFMDHPWPSRSPDLCPLDVYNIDK